MLPAFIPPGWHADDTIALEALMKTLFGLFGTGGLGREVMPWAPAALQNHYSELADGNFDSVFLENSPATNIVNGCSSLSVSDFVTHSAARKLFHVCIGEGTARLDIAERLFSQGHEPAHLIHPTVELRHNISLGKGAYIGEWSTLTTDIEAGDYMQCSSMVLIAPGCRIGAGVTLSPRVCCGPFTHIEDRVEIGTSAMILGGTKDNPLTIGRDAVIGMGAVITKPVPAGAVVVGNPGKIIRVKEPAST